ncbi:MAG: TIGR01244 family sulfur transferase [Pseudomonadota bacterium]
MRRLDQNVWVAPQIAIADLEHAAAQGITVMVNNRPDGEDVGQPTSADMQAAAQAVGLDYIHAPVMGMPSPDVVSKVATVLAQDTPVLLYCRSGTRSTIAWALAMRSLGRGEPDELRETAANAGYDLSRLPL